ncbi:MAG: LLM class flavin-dependent oxidoreductase [Actinomycetota bacterium]
MAVEFWTTGAAAGPRRAATLAARMEEEGWDGLATVDSQNLATDPYVFLALAATATERLGLMTSVTNVVTRHAAVTASSALTVQHLSGGRFRLGIGRGDSALAHIGLAPARLDWFERYLRHLATYVRAGEVDLGELVTPDHIAPPVDGLGLADRPESSTIAWADRVAPVPVDVAATGPRVIAAAARRADRVLFALGADPKRVAWGIETATRAAEDAGRDPSELSFGAYVNVVCHDDVVTARAIGRGSASLFARFSAMHGSVNAPADDTQTEVFEAVHAAYDMNRHARNDGAQTEVLTDDFLDTFAIFGSVDRCVDGLGRLVELGVSHFNVSGASVASDDPESAAATERLINEVAPQVRG